MHQSLSFWRRFLPHSSWRSQASRMRRPLLESLEARELLCADPEDAENKVWMNLGLGGVSEYDTLTGDTTQPYYDYEGVIIAGRSNDAVCPDETPDYSDSVDVYFEPRGMATYG